MGKVGWRFWSVWCVMLLRIVLQVWLELGECYVSKGCNWLYDVLQWCRLFLWLMQLSRVWFYMVFGRLVFVCYSFIVFYQCVFVCGVCMFSVLFIIGVVIGIFFVVVNVVMCLNGCCYVCRVRLKVLLWIGSSYLLCRFRCVCSVCFGCMCMNVQWGLQVLVLIMVRLNGLYFLLMVLKLLKQLVLLLKKMWKLLFWIIYEVYRLWLLLFRSWLEKCWFGVVVRCRLLVLVDCYQFSCLILCVFIFYVISWLLMLSGVMKCVVLLVSCMIVVWFRWLQWLCERIILVIGGSVLMLIGGVWKCVGFIYCIGEVCLENIGLVSQYWLCSFSRIVECFSWNRLWFGVVFSVVWFSGFIGIGCVGMVFLGLLNRNVYQIFVLVCRFIVGWGRVLWNLLLWYCGELGKLGRDQDLQKVQVVMVRILSRRIRSRCFMGDVC